jgi:hypothetical protein
VHEANNNDDDFHCATTFCEVDISSGEVAGVGDVCVSSYHSVEGGAFHKNSFRVPLSKCGVEAASPTSQQQQHPGQSLLAQQFREHGKE